MTASERKIKILLYPGNDFHGSLQPESLQVLTYLKVANALYNDRTVVEESSYARTPSLTEDQNDRQPVSRPLNIILHLQELGYDSDRHLTQKQRVELVSLDALLLDMLRPALLYLRWLDNDNYLSTTSKAFGGLYPFPLSLFYLTWGHRSASQLIMRGTAREVSMQERGVEVLNRAGKCLSLLSARLGSSDYFCGDLPSSQDALVFGYLDLLLQLSNRRLPLNKNLELLCLRMRRELYPGKKTRNSKSSDSADAGVGEKEGDKKWSSGSWLFVGAGLIAVALHGHKMGYF